MGACALTPNSEGYYLIGSAQDLQDFAVGINDGTIASDANAKLTANIDLNGSEDNQWTPIGTDANRYNGSFDGQGYTIKNLFFKQEVENIGLFGFSNNNAIIKNVRVEGFIDITNPDGNNDAGKNRTVGGIVGFAVGSTIINCSFSGSVASYSHVGGIVGWANNSVKVVNCYNEGIVTVYSHSLQEMGGIVGKGSAVCINCYNVGDLQNALGGSVIIYPVWRNVETCYYRAKCCKETNNSSWSNGNGGGIAMSEAEMKAEAFVTILNENVNSLKESYPDICEWKVTDGYPGHLFEYVQEEVNIKSNYKSLDDYIASSVITIADTPEDDGDNYINPIISNITKVYIDLTKGSTNGKYCYLGINNYENTEVICFSSIYAQSISAINIFIHNKPYNIKNLAENGTFNWLYYNPNNHNEVIFDVIEYFGQVGYIKNWQKNFGTSFIVNIVTDEILNGAPKYTITLDHNKGTGDPEQISIAYGQPMPEYIGLVAPTKAGYDFTGYSRNGIYYYDAKLKSVRNFDKQQDYTLYATWKAHTTMVALDFQGGQNGTAQVTATYGKAMPTDENIVAPTRAGYTFGGYFTSANGKGTQYYNADMTSTRTWYKDISEITLYAKWIPEVYVADITLSDVATDLWIGKTKTLTATIVPTNATITAVTWTSSNTAVATVSSKGVIKGIAKGTATITCKATDGSGISKACTVTVKQPVTSIDLSETEATLWVGKTKKLTATVDPTTASKTTVNWYSSDENVATVNKYGTITATGRGSCTITCEAADGYGTKAVCDVTVKQQVTSVAFGYETLTVTCGTTKTLTPKINPSNASVQTLSWKSKNTSVATVTSAGVLKAIAPGTAQIICTATDGFKKADTITVEVVPLKITDSKPTIAEGTYGIGGIVYTRTLTEGKYAAFCLPYNVNLNDYTDEFAKVYVPMGMAFLKPNGTLMVMFKKVSLTETIKAGKPFVALAAKSGAVAITNDYKKTFTTLTNPEPASLDVYNWSGSNGFLDFNPDITAKIGGNYGKLTSLDSEKYYLVSTSGAMSKAASVSPYRIYVYKDDKNSNAKVTEIIFSFDEDEMATGVENITNDLRDDDKIYNINGQRINKVNAQKGIYIKNGKKYANKN